MIKPENEQIFRITSKLKILGDPVRLRIARMLTNRELSVNEIVQVVGLLQPIVSRKLGELRGVGIVSFRKIGKQIFYTQSYDFAHSPLGNIVVTAQSPKFTQDLQKIHQILKKRAKVK
jgi:DNA-binding transcriptional ArsR family regulator